MRRFYLLAAMVACSSCGSCEDAIDQVLPPSSPTTYASSRIEGPGEVRVGEAVQYRLFARLLGSNQEEEVTTSASWSTIPQGRLNVSASGSAVGSTEGSTMLSGIIMGISASLNVNVVAAAATPPTDTVPPTTPTAETRVECPVQVTLGETSSCTATYLSNGVSQRVNDVALWSSSDAGILSVSPTGRITGNTAGVAFVKALHEATQGTARVTVVVGASGTFAAAFTPLSNTCGAGFRSGSYTMLISDIRGDLVSATAPTSQVYAFSFTQGSDGRVRISGRSSANGFDYAMELTQDTPGGTRWSGREDIRGATGCQASYLVQLDRIP